MLGLWIKKLLTTYAKHKLRNFRTAYNFNNQDDEYSFFVMVKMVRPDTRAGLLDTKSNLETMNMSQFKHDITRANLKIVEWINEISIDGENYLEIVRQKFNIYATS